MADWIRTDERLPEKSGKYLVTYSTPKGKRHTEERWFYGTYQGWTKGNGRPVAWQPMPVPYTEDERK